MRKIGLFAAAMVITLSGLTGCGSQTEEPSQTPALTEATDAAESVTPTGTADTAKNADEEILSETQAGEYTLRMKRTGGKKIEDELSPYNDLYEGTYVIESVKGNTVTDAYTVVFDSDTVLYFPESLDLQVFDLDEDGQPEFSLGQKIGSSAMEYHFYTLTSQGKIKEYRKENHSSLVIITDGREGYAPAFQVKNGEITYYAYDQKTAKTVKKVKKVV